MELRQLRYFVTVAEELHFGRAAERLNIVQPAVSQQIRRLERELGVTLLDRSPRRVRLTSQGERLLPEARAVLDAADRTAAVAAGLAVGGRRVLRVGTSPGLSARLEPGLATLQRLVPEMEVEIDGRPVAAALAAVRTGELDVAIVRTGADDPLRDVPTLWTAKLWREPVHVALTSSHPLAGTLSLRLDQLADLPLRVPSDSCDPLVRGFTVDACRRAGFEPREGRPSGSLPDTLVEIGAGPPAWTLVYGDAVATTERVAVIPVEPELTVAGTLVTSATKSSACAGTLRQAFAARGDDPALTRPGARPDPAASAADGAPSPGHPTPLGAGAADRRAWMSRWNVKRAHTD